MFILCNKTFLAGIDDPKFEAPMGAAGPWDADVVVERLAGA